MKWIFRAGWLVAVIGGLLCARPSCANAAVLSLPFTNWPTATLSTVHDYALSNQFTFVPITTSNQGRLFFGVFSPSTTNSKLAIHSDDGSDVIINYNPIWIKKGVGTSLENDNSFKGIPGPDTNGAAFVVGQYYCVSINYSNMEHTAGDKDGVTLYAFDGGGTVQDNLPVDGPDFICLGTTSTFTTCPCTGSAEWSSSAPGIATVTGNQASGYVQGVGIGTVTITASNTVYGRIGSRVVQVAPLGITPLSFTNCEGSPVTFEVTNPVTSGVQWFPAQTVSANTRTNTVSFTGGGSIVVTSRWNGCEAYATGTVVQVASVTASTSNLCNSGSVGYYATTTPPGHEGMLIWNGAFIGFGATQYVTYTSPGVFSAWANCGTSSRTNTITVHKVDITNTLEYTLAAGSAAPFGLSGDSVGPFTWSVTPSGPSVNGSGSNVTVSPGSTPGMFTVKAQATDLSSCNDTSTLQVVQVAFSSSGMAFCEGTTSNVTFSVNPTNAISLLSFDTVTNTATGGTNTHSHVTVSGTNLTVYGDVAGTAYLRAKIGNTVLVGPTLQIVRVTFPTNDWYVGVGKSITNTVTIFPANAPVTFDTVSNAIATAQAVTGGVKLTGVAPGTTQVRAVVGGGMVCSTKNVTAVRVKFATNALTLCNGNPGSVDAAVDPPGSPVTFTPSSSNLLQVTVVGTNVTVTPRTNGAVSVNAQVGGGTVDSLLVWSLTVRFPSNTWYAAPGGNQPYTVFIDPPQFAHLVGFMSSDTNFVTVTVGAAPRNVIVHGVTNGSADVRATVNGTNNLCSSKTVTVTTPTIASVQWLYLNGTPITDANPNPGGGLRLFPDSPAPGAFPSNQVRIRATVTPPINVSNAVFFRVIDVDDPFTNAPPIDDESRDADNRGGLIHVSGAAFSTDVNGAADAIFTLSMQPGDNFKAVAASSTNLLAAMFAKQNDGLNASVTNASGSPVPGNQITPLLTVWRRLHLEVDSMAPVTNNFVNGNITAIAGSATVATNLTLSINLRTGLTPVDGSPNLSTTTNRGRFQNGWSRIGSNAVLTSSLFGNGDTSIVNFNGFSIPGEIIAGGSTINVGQIVALSGGVFTFTGDLGATFYGGNSFRAAGTAFTIATNTAHTVTVTNTVAIPFTLHDDDDDTLLPHLPDTTLMADKFAPAYIVPIVDGGGNPNNNKQTVGFAANVDAGSHAAIDVQLSKASAFESDGNRISSYWVAYVQTAYQAHPTNDYDPDGALEWGPHGVTGGGTSFRRGALMFSESLRDYGVQVGWNSTQLTTLERRQVVHEIGHEFGITHSDPTQDVGINNYALVYNLSLDPGFEGVLLDIIRSKITSPGR